MQKGFFIVLEGPDGAGTTTHAALLAERLQKEGREVILTAEPTQGKYGKEIREALKGAPPFDSAQGRRGAPTPGDIQELFSRDRADHITTLIEPALAQGKIVISDRYIPSTLVYGEAQDLGLEWLQSLNKSFIQPNCTFLLLPPFEICFARVSKRAVRDTFEQEQFQRKVYEGYRKFAEEHPEVMVIDTSGGKEGSADLIFAAVEKMVALDGK